MSKVRSVLLAAVAAVAFGSFANPTLVSWENDFSALVKDGVTLDLQGNEPDEGGGITIGSKGLKLTRSGNFAGAASNAAVTVIIEASNLSSVVGVLGGVIYNTSDVTARRNEDGTITTYWTTTKGSTSTRALTDANAHRLAFVCGNAGASQVGPHAYVDGEEWVCRLTSYSSANAITGALVGGNIAGDSVATGMKVSRIAVVDGALTPEEVEAYVWPSARSDYYDHYVDNFKGRVLSMTNRTKSDINSYSFTATYFDVEKRQDTTKTVVGNAKTTDLPGYTGETAQPPWNMFCSGQGGYVAPGCVMRIPPCSPDCTWKMELGFAPLNLGGLIVEEGAIGTAVVDKMLGPGEVAQIHSNTDTNGAKKVRAVQLGDKSGTVPSWFVIKEDFLVDPYGGTITLYGEVNFDIAAGSTFHCQTVEDLASVVLDPGTSAILKMHGAGTLKFPTLTATGTVGLDYSDLSPDRETPYLDGSITIDSSTTIALPAALANGGRYKLCSGTVTAATVPASVWVGETEVTAFSLVGNEIVIETTVWTNATGDNNWSTAANWSNGLPGEGSVVFLDAKAAVNIESADIFAGVLVHGRGWVLDGTVSTTTIDCSKLSASSLNGARVFRCAGETKPDFTFVNLDSRFGTVWNGDALVITLTTVADETLAYYRECTAFAPTLASANVYTWPDEALSSRATLFDPLLGTGTGESYAGTSWHVFCSGQVEYEGDAIFRATPKTWSSVSWQFSPFAVGGFLIEPGVDGLDISCPSSNNRHDYLGDYKGNVAESWSIIDSDFTVSHGIQDFTLCGIVNLRIAEGKTFTIKSSKPGLKAGATLKMHGAGTFKVEERHEDGKDAPAEAGVFQAVSNAKLDYSGLALDRETPFIDGDLKVDETTRFAFPAGLESGVAYPLCSGTLTAPEDVLIEQVTVGDEVKTVFLTFSGNAVTYRDDAAARIGNTIYETVQGAIDAADADSVIDVIKGGAVTLAASKTIKSLNTLGDVSISGTATLTLAADGVFTVDEGKTLTVNTPVVLAGLVGKKGLGKIVFGSSVDPFDPETYDTGKKDDKDNTIWDYPQDRQQLAVYEGFADFYGAVKAVTVRGCGRDSAPANWPVIALKEGCSLSDRAVATPVRYTGAADGDSVPYYGKVVHDGATFSYTGSLNLMAPNWGEGKYEIVSGSFTCSGRLSLQWDDYRKGKMSFEVNGGELTVNEFNMCRTGTSDNDTSRYRLVVNGGVVTTTHGIVGTDSDGVIGWKDHKRLELNGGTWNVGNKENPIYDTNVVWVAASGDITLANNAGKTSVVPDCLAGMDSLTFAGAGTLDARGLAGQAIDYGVTGGTLLLGEGNVVETTTLRASGTGKFGLEFEGEKNVKTLYFGDKVRTRGHVYGVGKAGASHFTETEPCGSVRLLEGKDETGVIMVVR